MKQIKKFVPKIVALLLCCAMILPVSAAGLPEEGEVLPLPYSAVAEYIADATETRVEEINGETVTYYFGDGIGVAMDSTGYYLAEFGTDPFWISINGRMLDTFTQPIYSPRIDLPTDWSTIIDTGYQSVDIAGLSFTAAGLAVEAAIAVFAPYAAPMGTAISAAIELLGYSAVPDGYYATFRFVSKVRIIEISPTIGEYDDALTVYLGPSNNLYKTKLIDNHDVYEKPIDGY